MKKLYIKFKEGRDSRSIGLIGRKVVLPKSPFSPEVGEEWIVEVEERDRYYFATPVEKIEWDICPICGQEVLSYLGSSSIFGDGIYPVEEKESVCFNCETAIRKKLSGSKMTVETYELKVDGNWKVREIVVYKNDESFEVQKEIQSDWIKMVDSRRVECFKNPNSPRGYYYPREAWEIEANGKICLKSMCVFPITSKSLKEDALKDAARAALEKGKPSFSRDTTYSPIGFGFED